ncbi:Cell division protein FtsB [Gammaproteobacteria bacterium]
MMKWLAALLVLLVVGLQYRLWNGAGSLEEVTALHQAIKDQTGENKRLLERNQALEAEVRDLKSGLDAVEERARMELGMVKKDESFFLVVEK